MENSKFIEDIKEEVKDMKDSKKAQNEKLINAGLLLAVGYILGKRKGFKVGLVKGKLEGYTEGMKDLVDNIVRK